MSLLLRIFDGGIGEHTMRLGLWSKGNGGTNTDCVESVVFCFRATFQPALEFRSQLTDSGVVPMKQTATRKLHFTNILLLKLTMED